MRYIMKKIDLNSLENSNRDTIRMSQNNIYEVLKSEHDYWGLNSILEMLDFCKRNQLDWIVKPLESLKLIN